MHFLSNSGSNDYYLQGVTIQSPRGGGDRIFCRGQIIFLTRLGDALKISHFITCLLHRKHIDVNYIFHADSAPKLFILEIEWWPPYALVKTVQLTLLHIRSEVTGLYSPIHIS